MIPYSHFPAIDIISITDSFRRIVHRYIVIFCCIFGFACISHYRIFCAFVFCSCFVSIYWVSIIVVVGVSRTSCLSGVEPASLCGGPRRIKIHAIFMRGRIKRASDRLGIDRRRVFAADCLISPRERGRTISAKRRGSTPSLVFAVRLVVLASLAPAGVCLLL